MSKCALLAAASSSYLHSTKQHSRPILKLLYSKRQQLRRLVEESIVFQACGLYRFLSARASLSGEQGCKATGVHQSDICESPPSESRTQTPIWKNLLNSPPPPGIHPFLPHNNPSTLILHHNTPPQAVSSKSHVLNSSPSPSWIPRIPQVTTTQLPSFTLQTLLTEIV